ncbi:p-loop containing nucleoside triphosphate hydrolase [Pleurostoma richardsiae]|uniref:P-loop containing nucleoside triphosphate hydrolase n=1 Tax=Pleurostoma richardsiae TaxID=41990 RepID=A0AA38R4L2_9PEZI|nr:p-loop containing nucleoside triphosphate hydrolase [Pleurostoma richardsiae]
MSPSPFAARLSSLANDSAGLYPALSNPVTYEVVYTTDLMKRPRRLNLEESDYDAVVPQEQTVVLEIQKHVDVDMVENDRYSGPLGNNRVVKIRSEQMIIHSADLIDAVAEAVGYYPSGIWHGETNTMLGHSRSLKIIKPYRMFGIAERQALRKLQEKYRGAISSADSEADAEKYRMLETQIGYLDHELEKSQGARTAEEEMRYNQDPPVATFNMLWLLFRPGSIVFTKIGNETVACRVYLLQWNRPEDGLIYDVTVDMWYLDFDGQKLNRVNHAVDITRFQGEIPIADLAVCPVLHAKDDSLRAKLINRGKKFYQLLSKSYVEVDYRGLVTESRDRESGQFYFGRAIIDPRFAEMEGLRDTSEIEWKEFKFKDIVMKSFVDIDPLKPDNELTDDHYVLMPATILGFALGIRQWVHLEVDHIEIHNYDKTLVDTLIMDEKDKKIITAMSSSAYSDTALLDDRNKAFMVDPIRGKGEGKIFLLHGNPGTGKTYTAECVAEYTGRPLLRLSTAELGTSPSTLEAILLRWFRYALHWEAIILIDEAEVYMRQRSSEYHYTLDHETIVTIFLRTMDYYRGVIFLTTNQPLHLDWAIMNRVSYVVRYADLRLDQKTQIRLKAVERIKKSRRYDILSGAIKTWESMDKSKFISNGRQILSAIQQAIALAEADAASSGNDDGDGGEHKGPSRIVVEAEHAQDILSSMERQYNYEMEAHNNMSPQERARDRGDIGRTAPA